MFQFLWSRNLDSSKFHLASWKILSLPHSLGGWGIKHLENFNLALCAKLVWRCLFSVVLWGDLVKEKYLRGLDLVHWF